MSYVGKVTAGGATHLVGSTLYGTCATAAATAQKDVTCSDFDELITGATIHVKFTYSNTAATPTLKVGSTAAKNIYKYGTTKPGTTAATSWQAGSVISFTYDGSYWQMNDHLDDTNTQTVSSVAGKTGAVTLTSSDVGLGNVGNFKAVSTVASQGLTDTEKSNARTNIGAGTSSLTLGTTSTTALKGDTKYAGASTAGGAATSAAKLTNTAKIGDTNKPVYFTASGVPSAISYTIDKSVPSNAVFTDTTYTLATGDSNGQIKVTPTGGTAYNVSVKGLGSNAYTSTAYLPLTGGTLSDVLTIARTSYTEDQPNPGLILKASNQDVTTNPSSNQWNNSELNFQDKNGVRTGYVNIRQDTDGTMSLHLEASTKDGSTTRHNHFTIAVDKSGNQSYQVSNPAAFRSAIGLGAAATLGTSGTYTSTGTEVFTRAGAYNLYNDVISANNRLGAMAYKNWMDANETASNIEGTRGCGFIMGGANRLSIFNVAGNAGSYAVTITSITSANVTDWFTITCNATTGLLTVKNKSTSAHYLTIIGCC